MSSYRVIWVWCFAGTAAAFLSTAIPLLGILFVMLGAPFLPVLFVNIAFVAMAVDAWKSRFWLLFVPPLIWFGGYTVIAVASHWQVSAIRDAANRQNAAAIIRWNRTTQIVRIDKIGTSGENWASDITPVKLVERYGLDEAFETYRPEIGSGAVAIHTQHVMLDRKACPGRGFAAPESVQFDQISRGGYPAKTPMQWAQGVCLIFQHDVSLPDTPVVVALAPVRRLSGLVDGIEQDISVSGPDQPALTLRAVQVAPLPWWPMPILGCHYNGGFGDQWDKGCHAELRFDSWRGQAANTPTAIAARALRLKPMTIERRLPGVDWK